MFMMNFFDIFFVTTHGFYPWFLINANLVDKHIFLKPVANMNKFHSL